MKGENSTYRPEAGMTCLMSGPNMDDANGYVYYETAIVWRDDVFVVSKSRDNWPTVNKWDHVLCKPLLAPLDGKFTDLESLKPGMKVEMPDGELYTVILTPNEPNTVSNVMNTHQKAAYFTEAYVAAQYKKAAYLSDHLKATVLNAYLWYFENFEMVTPPASSDTPTPETQRMNNPPGDTAFVGTRANDRQEGGSHYKSFGVEPWDIVALNDLDAFQGEILYYLMRWKLKNGIEDLKKAQHWLAKYLEVELARVDRGTAGMKAMLLSNAANKMDLPQHGPLSVKTEG